jgi:hypothetical protein
MADLKKISIKPKSFGVPLEILPTKKVRGFVKDGPSDGTGAIDVVDLFQDSLALDWFDFMGDFSVPMYDEAKMLHMIGVKTNITCTSDYSSEVEENAIRAGLTEMLEYYDKSYDNSLINSILSKEDNEVNGSDKHICRMTDRHMSPRPSDKLKLLVVIEASYFNALQNNDPHPVYLDALDENNNLVITNGLIKPTLATNEFGQPLTMNGSFTVEQENPDFAGISVVTLRSDAFERELVKVSNVIMTHHNAMRSQGLKIPGVNLAREAERFYTIPALLPKFVLSNYSANGYSHAKTKDYAWSDIDTSPLNIQDQTNAYHIKLAFQSAEDGGVNLIWAAVNFGKKDEYLGIGFKNLVSSNPMNNPTTMNFFFYHQQILANLDRSIELSWMEFVEGYHYPKKGMDEIINANSLSAPFQNDLADLPQDQLNNINPAATPNQAPDKPPKPKKKCGWSWPAPLEMTFNFGDMLRDLLEPVSFEMGITLNLFSLGPPCPAITTGIGIPFIFEGKHFAFSRSMANTTKYIEQMVDEQVEGFDDVRDYYTSESFINDFKHKMNNPILAHRLSQLWDAITSRFTTEKMLQLVCICLMEMADDWVEDTFDDPLMIPEPKASLKAPGFAFDPTMLADFGMQMSYDPASNQFSTEFTASDEFNLDEALELTYQLSDLASADLNMKPFSLTQLCSFCINLPILLPRLPTWDMFKIALDLLAALLELLLVQILLALILQLLNWLLKCPDYSCELRPRGAAINDYGTQDLKNSFPDEVPNVLGKCESLGIPPDIQSESGATLAEMNVALMDRISEELSSGEILNLMEGYPSESTVMIVKDIVFQDAQFESLRGYLFNEAKVEDYIICVADVIPESVVKNLEVLTKDPEYCLTPDNLPSAFMQKKCPDQDEAKKFLLREKSSKAVQLKGIIDELRSNPAFFQELIPNVLSTRDEETNQLQKGLLSQDEYKPPVTDTMIELAVYPMVDSINTYARIDGPRFVKSLYSSDPEGSPNLSWLKNMAPVLVSMAKLPISPIELPIAIRLNSDYPMPGGFLRNHLMNFDSWTTFVTSGPDGKVLQATEGAPAPPGGLSSRQFNDWIIAGISEGWTPSLTTPQPGITDMKMYLESSTNYQISSDSLDGLGNFIALDFGSSCPSVGTPGSPLTPTEVWTGTEEFKNFNPYKGKCITSNSNPFSVLATNPNGQGQSNASIFPYPNTFVLRNYSTGFNYFQVFNPNTGEIVSPPVWKQEFVPVERRTIFFPTTTPTSTIIDHIKENIINLDSVANNLEDVYDKMDSPLKSPQAQVLSQMVLRGAKYGSKNQSDNFKKDISQIDMISLQIKKFVENQMHMRMVKLVLNYMAKETSNSDFFKTFKFSDFFPGQDPNPDNPSVTMMYDPKEYHPAMPTPAEMSRSYDTDFLKYQGIFKADDSGESNEKEYFKPVPALENTALRKGAFTLLDREEIKEKVKEEWDMAEEWDPNDLDELPPLNKAMLDQFIPEFIQIYCIDVALKAGFLFDVFGYDTDEAGGTLITDMISDAVMGELKIYTNFYNKFMGAVEDYWVRRYKEDDSLNPADAPTGKAALNMLISDPQKGVPMAIQKVRNKLLRFLHRTNAAGEACPSPPVSPSDVLASPGILSAARSMPLSNFFVSPTTKLPVKTMPFYSYVERAENDDPDLYDGKFVYETYLHIELTDQMKEVFLAVNPMEFHYLVNKNIFSVEGGINVDFSPESIQSGINPATATGNNYKSEYGLLLQGIYRGYHEYLMTNTDEGNMMTQWFSLGFDANELFSGTSIEMFNKTFKELRHGMRMSYVQVEKDVVATDEEDMFDKAVNDILTAQAAMPVEMQLLHGGIGEQLAKNKAYVYTEGYDGVASGPEFAEMIGPSYKTADFEGLRRVLVMPLIYADTVNLEGTDALTTSDFQIGIDFGSDTFDYFFTGIMAGGMGTTTPSDEFEDEMGLSTFANFDTNIKQSFSQPYNSDQEIYFKLRNNIRNSNDWKTLFNYSLMSNTMLDVLLVYCMLAFYETGSGFAGFDNTKLSFLRIIAKLMTRSGLDALPIDDTSDDLPPPPPDENNPNQSEEEEDEDLPPEPECSD